MWIEIAIFVLGYLAIVFEHTIRVNKAATALLTGVACWTAHVLQAEPTLVVERLGHHVGDVAQILFFLLSAMTIVELVDAHDGFAIVTARVTTTSRRKLLVIVAAVSFFLSAVLDNLTTAIVMTSLVRKLVADADERLHYGGVVIIAANAGGAWSPIGDVTTTMLWVGERITAGRVITTVFVPALVSVAIPTLWIALRMKGRLHRADDADVSIDTVPMETGTVGLTLSQATAAVGRSLAELDLRAKTGVSVVSITRDGGEVFVPSPRQVLRVGDRLALAGEPGAIDSAVELLVRGRGPKATTDRERALVFATGLGVLLFVPIFKLVTHLPPLMGILLGLGVLWLVTELVHKRKNDEARSALTVAGALQRVDAQSVLFFLGILLAIGALESDGTLALLARTLDRTLGDPNVITPAIGVISSVVDNVPLVAAAQGMYGLSSFPCDHPFWLFLAYCAGTGGSILIIGSAAGVAVMGIERITFGAYVRRLSLPALAGYAAGAVTYLLVNRS